MTNLSTPDLRMSAAASRALPNRPVAIHSSSDHFGTAPVVGVALRSRALMAVIEGSPP